mmetsp:Transcript_17827/g.58677  ORF Transcript_17827/g.58677 Transcript_17827/m.58677 type:complete len:203 (+) Transcript_17827:176-784(+)
MDVIVSSLHSGQVCCLCSHRITQAEWKTWPHGSVMARLPAHMPSRQIQHGSAIVQGRGCPEPRSASSSSNSSASRLNSPPPSAERACHIRRSSAPEAARRRETGRRAERGRNGTSLRAEASGTPVKPSRASRQRASSTLAARASPEADARLPGGGAPCNASSLAAAGDGSRAWPRRSSVLAGRQSGLCFLELVGVTLDPATA